MTLLQEIIKAQAPYYNLLPGVLKKQIEACVKKIVERFLLDYDEVQRARIKELELQNILLRKENKSLVYLLRARNATGCGSLN